VLDVSIVTLRSHGTQGPETSAVFDTPDGAYRVRVQTVVDPATATRLTCNALRDNPVPAHEVLTIEPVDF